MILDRRKLPDKIEYLECKNYEEVARAIEDMVIQGAGSIAYTAGYGMALALAGTKDESEKFSMLKKSAERMKKTRPTGSTIFYVVDKLQEIAENSIREGGDPVRAIVEAVKSMIDRAHETAIKCGFQASKLLEDGDRILVHCFPGPALYYMLDEARKDGKRVEVVATETRPYLQGARLTAFMLKEAGIPVTLITDNMVAYCMWKGMVQKFFTAADRIALDGSIANKVGTYQYAICAHEHGIPFYVLGYGGPDKNTPSYREIVVEERSQEEVLYLRGVRVAPEGISAYYPAFDITPPKFIRAIVTDRGIFSPASMRDYWKI
jgi:methylthioribose-1-phosphate isomerase